MFKRRLLALAAGLTIGLPGLSTATILPDRFEDLPSSFSGKAARSDGGDGWLENRATVGLTGKDDIFSRYKFPGISFENAASEGLSAARPEKKARSVEQLIATAGHRQEDYGMPGESAGRHVTLPRAAVAPTGIGAAGTSLRDIARVVVNKPAQTGREKQTEGGPAKQGGASFFDVVLAAQLDDAFIDAATNVVTPTVTDDGLIALNFMGLREFALLVSPTNNKVQVMDLNTGTTLTMSPSAYEGSASRRGEPIRYQGNRRGTNGYSGDHPARKMLWALQNFVENVLLHPLALGALLLLALGWSVFSLIPRWR